MMGAASVHHNVASHTLYNEIWTMSYSNTWWHNYYKESFDKGNEIIPQT